MVFRSPASSAIALSLSLACGLVAPAWGHAKVTKAEPSDGAVLSKPPGEVRVSFDEAIEPAFTTLQLRDAAGKPVAATPTVVAAVSGHTAVLPMPPTMDSGRYSVHWTTVGPDGHRVQGDLHFTVK